MKTPLFTSVGTAGPVSNSADRYLPLSGGGSNIASATTSGAGGPLGVQRFPIDGKVSLLRARFPTPITSGTYTVTLMVGATPTTMVATGLSCTISSAGIVAQNLVTEVAVSAGDLGIWRVSPSGTPAAQAMVQIASNFEATTTGQSLLFSYIAPGTSAGFCGLGVGAPNNAVEAVQTSIFPCPGTIRKLYVDLSAAPGTGNSRTITIRKGTATGALSDTALTVTISGTATGGSIDLGGSPISIATGDHVSIQQSLGGTPASSSVKIATDFIPTTSGQAPLFGQWAGAVSASADRFANVSGSSSSGESTESNVYNLAPVDLTLKSVRGDISTAPGAGKSRSIGVRKNGVLSALVASISEASTTNTATADVAVSAGDVINLVTSPTATPASVTWARGSTIAVVSSAAAAVNFAPSDRAGQTFEGIRNTSKVQVAGGYSGAPTDVQVRLVDAGNNAVTSWTSAAAQADGAYSHIFSGVPIGGPYYQQVRDNGGTATASPADLYVGAVVFLWGQSQCQKLHTADVSGLTPQNGMQVRILTYTSQTDVSTAGTTLTKFDSSTTGLALRTGSGVVALAHQWHADTGGTVPLMIVTTAYQGTSIYRWVNNEKGSDAALGDSTTDVTPLWGTSPTTGFAWFMAAAAKYQASAVVMMQGTADVANQDNIRGSGNDYTYYMDALKAKWESLLNALPNSPLFLVVPHQRSDDDSATNVFNLRTKQYLKAISGGAWRLCCWLLDWQMDGNGSPHQANGATGNIRGGTRIGRGIAKWLFNQALDISGPQITGCRFTNGALNVIEITFDRDIDPNELLGFVVSTNNGSSFTSLAAPGLTAARVASNKVHLTRAGGSPWVQGATRIDNLRGTPFSSDVAVSDYVGPESSMEADYLSKVVTDTTAFDGGRGMPMAPIMGTGYAVADPPLSADLSMVEQGDQSTSSAALRAKAQTTAVEASDTSTASAKGRVRASVTAAEQGDTAFASASNTLRIYAGEDDVTVESFDPDYATARAGGALNRINTQALFVGQLTGYYLVKSFLAFDTSTIVDPIVSARLVINVTSLRDWNGRTAEFRRFDWLGTAGWLDPNALGTYPLLGSKAITSLGLNQIDVSPIPKASRFGIVAHSTDLRTATPPTGQNYFDIASASSAPADARPYLSITTAVPAFASVARTEESDLTTATGSLRVRATAFATEAADVSTAVARVDVKATTAATEANDIAAASGLVPAKASLRTSEQSDVPVALARLIGRGSANATEQSDTATATALIIGGARLTKLEQSDTSTAAARSKVRAAGSATEAADLAASVARLIAKAFSAVAEQSDTSSGFGYPGAPKGYVAVVEANDTSAVAARLLVRGLGDGIEADDALEATAHVPVLTPEERTLSLVSLGLAARTLQLVKA